MKREDLAEEIRGAGFMLRYADGPVLWGTAKSTKSPAKQAMRRKLKESDWTVVRRASTCHTCGSRASTSDIKEAEEMACDYQSFARQIWMAIDHDYFCCATPCVPISQDAQKAFARARKNFVKRTAKKAKKKST